MAYQHYRSQFGDTTFTKVFVGGLAWETPTEEMRKYFEQFGDILEAVIITDKTTGRSKGYGFVTFRDPESARRACVNPNPMIDGRRANCNIASFGRPRPSPPRGRTQGGPPFHGAGAVGATPYNQVGAPGAPPLLPPPPPPPVIYPPPYGYTTYTPDYGYSQAVYNPQFQPQYYHQVYGGGPSSPTVGSPYYYGYSLQSPRGSFGPQAHGIRGPSYVQYPVQGEGIYTTFSQQAGPLTTRQPFALSTEPQISEQQTSTTGATASESPST